MFEICFFRNQKGISPALEAFKIMPKKAEAKGRVRIERLEELGNRLTRPECDFLRDGIYELRWRFMKVQYRLLYFFSGKKVIVLSHIITKEKEIPAQEIDACVANKRLFEEDPDRYTYTLE